MSIYYDFYMARHVKNQRSIMIIFSFIKTHSKRIRYRKQVKNLRHKSYIHVF